MKTTPVSTASVSQSLRYQLLRMQTELISANQEATTGKVADLGLALGKRTAQSVSMSRDFERMNGIIDQNGLVSARLTATQNALGQMLDRAQSFLSTLTAGISGDASKQVVMTDAANTLDGLTAIVNTSFNGEHIFAGINTDVQPMAAYQGSPAKTAFDAAFVSFFGFSQSDPAAANITAVQMNSFIDTAVTPQFLGAGWETNWSQASDELITSRIALNETAQTSVNANGAGIRKLAMVATTVQEIFSSSTISAAARNALAERSAALVGEAIGDIGILQAQTGVAQQRVTKATERMEMQVDVFERTIGKLEGVDPYEAATRVSTLMDQIETSYALTARLQKLSLTKFQ